MFMKKFSKQTFSLFALLLAISLYAFASDIPLEGKTSKANSQSPFYVVKSFFESLFRKNTTTSSAIRRSKEGIKPTEQGAELKDAAKQNLTDEDIIPPSPPTIDGLTEVTNKDFILLTGKKEPYTTIYLNDKEIITPNEEDAYSYVVYLKEGENSFSLYSEDNAGNKSSPLVFSVTKDSQFPEVEVISPPDFSIVNDEHLNITGGLKDNVKVAAININGRQIPLKDDTFTIENIPLALGKNTLLIEASDSAGNRKTYLYTIYREEAKSPQQESSSSKEVSFEQKTIAEGYSPANLPSEGKVIEEGVSSAASNLENTTTPTAPKAFISGTKILSTTTTSVTNTTNTTNTTNITDTTATLTNNNGAVENISTSNASSNTSNSSENKPTGKPILTFSSPYEKQIITENALMIGGHFDPIAHVEAISIEGQPTTIDFTSNTFTGPTLLSPGEARRRGDDITQNPHKYIIMNVDPRTHSGKNTLTARITANGRTSEEKLTFYYYQLFVKAENEFILNGTKSFETQSFNLDLFNTSPFEYTGSWADYKVDYRWRAAFTPPPSYPWPWHYTKVDNYYFLINFFNNIYSKEEVEIISNSEPPNIYSWITNPKLVFHAPPFNDEPLILIFRGCRFQSAYEKNIPEKIDLSKYAIQSQPLKHLSGDIYNPEGGLYPYKYEVFDKTTYIILKDYSPDKDYPLDVKIEPSEGAVNALQSYKIGVFAFAKIDTLTADILVDSNNDGFLGGEDNVVEQTSPGCVFWVNTDDDYDESTVHPDDGDSKFNSSGKDGEDEKINGIRDLEDFMPFNIAIPNIKEWTKDKNVKFFLKAEGSGKIRVFERVKDMREYGSLTYLKDLNSAIAQYKKTAIWSLSDGVKKELDPNKFDDKGDFKGIFEGVSAGTLKLTLEVELGMDPNKEKVVLDEAVITLKDVRQMYKLINIREGPTRGTNDDILRYRNKEESKEIFAPDPTRVFIWAHGYNNTLEGSMGSGDIVYKRLYQTGFRGSFIFISWDTADWIRPFSAINFNGDWVNSFRSARITADIIKDIRTAYPNARIDLGAHSLGNNLACYALRLLAQEGSVPADNLIMAQPAVPGEVFSGTSRTVYYDMWGFRHDFFDNMYANSLDAVRGNIYNTYSTNDNALSLAFRGNNLILKLPTPLDDRYNLVNDNTSTIGNEFVDPLGLAAAHTPYNKVVNQARFISVNNHPYGIRDHCSMTVEYYYDVQRFYRLLIKPESDNEEE